jgi:hypothetical protein
MDELPASSGLRRVLRAANLTLPLGQWQVRRQQEQQIGFTGVRGSQRELSQARSEGPAAGHLEHLPAK